MTHGLAKSIDLTEYLNIGKFQTSKHLFIKFITMKKKIKLASTQKYIRTYSKNKELVSLRREHIIDSVTHLLTKRGYNSTSMREIADACDMPIGTLYRYIGSKDDILYLVINHFLSQIVMFTDEIHRFDKMNISESLKLSIEKFYRKVDEVKYLSLFAWQETKNLKEDAQQSILDGETRIIKAFESLLIKGIEKGDFKMHNTSVIAHNIVALGEMWAVRRWFIKNVCTLDEYIAEQTEFIFNSISVKNRNNILG